jgi:tRNA A-37 threonylcarbamoyl transferase component Bud32
MKRAGIDQDLLFGTVALQEGSVTRETLLAALQIWVADPNRALGAVLLEHQAFGQDDYARLTELVQQRQKGWGDAGGRYPAAVSEVGPPCPEVGADNRSDLERTTDYAGPRPGDALSGIAWTCRYHVLRPHAKGGLGQVSLAYDEELNREVALKEIQACHADDPDKRKRFVLEAEVTGYLEHPGVVPVYGLGAYADGRPYYAMRFLRGDSLKQAVARFHGGRQSRRPVREREREFRLLLSRFVAVCNTVAYAHSREVLHRDIKPANIMLGEFGETLVVDWGLAPIPFTLGASHSDLIPCV